MIKAIAALKRWGWFVALGLLLGTGAGFGAGLVAPPRVPSYDATSVVIFD